MSNSKQAKYFLNLLVNGEIAERFSLESYNTIGRHPSNSIQILDRMISKEHAIVTLEQGHFKVIDLGSRNGSYINSERITEGYISSGDQIQLGTVAFSFEEAKPIVHNVTIAENHEIISHQIAKLDQTELNRDFHPEKEIKDERQLRKDYEKLRIAHALNKKIAGELDIDSIYNLILDECFHLTAADRGSILIKNPAGELQTRAMKLRNSASSASDEISISKTILQNVMENKTAVLSSDAKIDDRFNRSESIIMQNIQAAMCVPLLSRTGENVLGILHLDSQKQIGAFTEKDLQITSAIASQAASAIENAQLVKDIEKEGIIRANLQRFLSPAVMNRLNKDELEIRMGGELVPTTVMFTDIRGFTTISENYDPVDLVKDLNQYFGLCVDAIFNQEGTLDKYIGDAIMAVWGTVEKSEKDPVRAVRAAVQMQQKLVLFNQQREEQGKPQFLTGIGINTGQAVAGNMGSQKRLEFTVIGDGVNISARLCSEAKGGEIIISQSTYEYVKHEFICTELPPATVKGKAVPLQIYRVEGDLPDNEELLNNDCTMI